jgi:S-adenosylmethionine hydrolase
VLLDAGDFRAFSITNRKYMRPEVSNTFHGRDIFAPAAGHLSTGVDASEFGEEINLSVKEIPKRVTINGQRHASVIHIDHFGNLVTDIPNDELPEHFELEICGTTVAKLYVFFAQAEPGEVFAMKGSAGFVEVAVRNGSAAEKLAAKLGDHIVIGIVS